MSRRLSKKLPMRVARLKEAYPTAKVELWCEDEHRLGLKPIIRKVWSPIGQRPLVEVHQRYEWSYLYSFVRPKTGEVHWLILPTVNAEVFSLALEHFAREVGTGTRKRILLVLDRAGSYNRKLWIGGSLRQMVYLPYNLRDKGTRYTDAKGIPRR
jgi:hypothetical protein